MHSLPSVAVEIESVEEGPVSAADYAERRAQALADLGIIDTPPEAIFDDLVTLASEICGTPIGLITLMDSGRQWFKSAVGLVISQTSIDMSFCLHAIAGTGLFLVEDATQDDRFKRHPFVVGEPHIRFYAGIPLYAGDGVAVGTLCVVDTVPRTLTPAQTRALTILSHQVQAHFDLRGERRKLLHQVHAKRELAARVELSKHFLTEANQKLDQLLAEVRGAMGGLWLPAEPIPGPVDGARSLM